MIGASDGTMYRIESTEIDDRIGWLSKEISDGKRDKDVRLLAGKILAGESGKFNVEARDWKGEVVAIFEYVRENVRYTRDIHNVELFQRPKRTLEHRIGDCDDMTILLGSLLMSVGYPIMIRVIGLKNTGTFQHVYLVVGLPPHDPKTWMPLDPSRPEKPGWELPKAQVGLKRDYEVED